jgi:hypothetical protein
MSKGFGSAPIRAEGQTVEYAWEIPEEVKFYEWCKTMYPQAIKEFKAVRDVQRSVKDGL